MSSKTLSATDLSQMLASGAKVSAESARLDAENLRAVVNQQAAEIAYLKAQITMAEAARTSHDRIKQAEDMLKAARRAHNELSEDMADRYSVDFKQTSFDPETGRIHTPGDDAEVH